MVNAMMLFMWAKETDFIMPEREVVIWKRKYQRKR